MKPGDLVRICPHGDPSAVAEARVVRASNGLFLALEFGEPVPFTGPVACGMNRQVLMFLRRTVLEGKPWGPWIDVACGGHFEIEDSGPPATPENCPV
jgi:hypothetical protein